MKIELGKKYRSKLYGIEGIAGAYTKFVTGCDQVRLDFVVSGERKYDWFDITDIEGIEIPKSERRPGGPQQTPPMRRP